MSTKTKILPVFEISSDESDADDFVEKRNARPCPKPRADYNGSNSSSSSSSSGGSGRRLNEENSKKFGNTVGAEFSTSTGPANASGWKGLMNVMQHNQKLAANFPGNKNGKAGGRGLKRTVSQPLQSSGNPENDDSNSDSPAAATIVVAVAKRAKLEILDDFNNNMCDQKNSAVFSASASVPPPTLGAMGKSISASSVLTKVLPTAVFPIFGGPEIKKLENPEVKPKPTTNIGDNNNCWKQERIEISLNKLEQVEAATGNGNTTKRECPFYKKIPGTAFSVDAFNYGVIPGIDVYFLSHFHSDHYIGLTKKFSKTLVCTPATGNLVKMKLGVSENCIRKLELDTIYRIQGVDVVLVDANHCPGSVMFILRLPNGKIILHTGDFRFTPDMLTNPFVSSLPKVDCLYLDTTYCDPKYDFPSQTDAIAQVLESVKRHLAYRSKTLIVCGAYCIGKERVFFTLAKALNMKVFCEADKRRVIRALEIPEFLPLLGDNESDCDIHVLPMRFLNPTYLSEYLAPRTKQYTNVVAVKPTGWEFSRTGKGMASKQFLNDTITVIGVPYSEHSSFSELRDFVSTLNPYKIQPTVNVGSEPKRAAMADFFKKWLSGKI